MLMAELGQDQAPQPENAECVSLCIVALLDVVAIHIAQRLGKPHSQPSPPFPLAGLLAESILSISSEYGSEETFSDQCLAVISPGVSAPSPNAVFDIDSGLTGDRLPVFILDMLLNVRPQVRVNRRFVHRVVTGSCFLQLEDSCFDDATSLPQASQKALSKDESGVPLVNAISEYRTFSKSVSR